MSLLQIILVGLIALIMMGAIVGVVMNREAERKKQVLNRIKGHATQKTNKISVQDEQNKRRAEIAKKLKESKGGDEKSGKKKRPRFR